tara:strand:+ start:2017 stop:2319 length:303 start_codon:yes stop_codon:yes gene_type:complete
MKKQKYTYTVAEQSVDVRTTEISSTVKLTWDEIQSVYSQGVDLETQNVQKGLEKYIDWCGERFTDYEISNKIKIEGSYQGTYYGDDAQLSIEGDIEEVQS